MAVDFDHMPLRGFETRDLIGVVRQGHRAIDGDVVVVPHHDELAQFVAAGEGNRLLAYAFHQAAVARDDIGVVIHDLCPVLRAQHLFGHGETDRIGDALAERAGGGLNRVGEEVLRVPGCARAHLAEVFQLFDGELLVACQVQQRIQQHGAMARRQDKAVTIRPKRVGRIKFQVLFEKHGCNIGHAHRHAGVARIGGGDGIEGQRANGGGLGPVIGVCACEGCQIHGAFLCGCGRLGLCIPAIGQSSSTTGRQQRCAVRAEVNSAPQVAETKGGAQFACALARIAETG